MLRRVYKPFLLCQVKHKYVNWISFSYHYSIWLLSNSNGSGFKSDKQQVLCLEVGLVYLVKIGVL